MVRHAEFDAGRVVPAIPNCLVLRSADNGGWIIEERGDFMNVGRTVGAYTNTRDMLDALEELLLVPRIKAEEGGDA